MVSLPPWAILFWSSVDEMRSIWRERGPALGEVAQWFPAAFLPEALASRMGLEECPEVGCAYRARGNRRRDHVKP